MLTICGNREIVKYLEGSQKIFKYGIKKWVGGKKFWFLVGGTNPGGHYEGPITPRNMDDEYPSQLLFFVYSCSKYM